MARLDDIKQKLTELQRLDSGLQFWGARNHEYRLHAPLAVDELRRYEEQYGVRFPESYASFLLELGNGGAGPGVGLYTLSESVSKFEEKCDWCKKHRYVRPCLDLPFPANTMLAEVMCKIHEQVANDIYEQMKRPKVHLPSNIDGVMEVSNESCCQLYLVVTGDQRGCIWSAGNQEDDWLPAGDDPNRLGFLDWYESWLDGSLMPGALESWLNSTGDDGDVTNGSR
jgi:hypothetical protein